MAEHLLPDFIINRNEPENGIRELVKIIKPHWNDQNVKLEAIIGGYSSRIFKCFDPEYPDEMITVRIRFMMDNFIESIEGLEKHVNELEPKAIQHFSRVGHFPKIHAIFANGYCYEYVKGKPIVNIKLRTGLMNDKMLKSIATELVYIHKTKLESVDYSADRFLHRMDLGQIPFTHNFEALSKETIKKEFQFIIELIENLNIPLVLCHSDPHPGNFVWNDEIDKITFLDWEGVSIGYQHVELAYFLVISQMFHPTGKENDVILPEDFENKFLNFYFEELCQVQHQEFNDEEFQTFKQNVHKCKLGPSLMFVCLSLIMPHIAAELSGENNPRKFYDMSLNVYQNLKEQIVGTRKFQIDL